MSVELSYGRHQGPPTHDADQAAVMILLVPTEHGWTVPLTLRPAHLKQHPGQISLPGGRCQPGETSWETAGRELCEEIGVPIARCRCLMAMTELFVFASNHRVQPWLAMAPYGVTYNPCPREVEQIISMPMEVLLEPRFRKMTTLRRGPVEFRSHCYAWDDHTLWGATAMILSELGALLQDNASPSL
jgi:8-oxo-dGTP pyrophosphatase MutT (NUDIX family)